MIAQLAGIVAALLQLGAPPERVAPVADAIVTYATAAHVDPFLVAAIAVVENPELNPRARNASGATGIMQVMPGWVRVHGKACGRVLTDVRTNVCIGVRVLAMHLSEGRTLTHGLNLYNGCTGCRYADSVLRRYARVRPPSNCEFIEFARDDSTRHYEGTCRGSAVPTYKDSIR